VRFVTRHRPPRTNPARDRDRDGRRSIRHRIWPRTSPPDPVGATTGGADGARLASLDLIHSNPADVAGLSVSRAEVLKGNRRLSIPLVNVAAAMFLGLALSVSGPTHSGTEARRVLVDPRVYEVVRARAHLEPQDALRWAVAIETEAARNRLPTSLVLGVITVESSFRADAKSPVGAIGLMQIMPSTGRTLAHRLGIPWRGVRTLRDPILNVRMGTAYLRRLIDYFGGRQRLALASYCHGPGVIRRYLKQGWVPQRRLRYAHKVRRAEQKILQQLERLTPEEVAML